jgi:4-diphosphocytidyl-2C-methyl-D-erythritol kinase
MANPGTAVLTKAAYEAMDAVGYTDAESAGYRLFVNDMEKYTLMADPKAATLKKFMLERLDAEEVLMSGSGPTMVAYFEDIDKAGKGLAALTELAVTDASIRAWLTDTGR